MIYMSRKAIPGFKSEKINLITIKTNIQDLVQMIFKNSLTMAERVS